MLISLVCVVLLMFAYTQLFSDVGGRIGDARSMIELTNRMQATAQRLRSDLAGHTCNMLPWQDPAAGDGYFEIIEGPLSDQNSGLANYSGSSTYMLTDRSVTPNTTYPMGDTDDVLMFTVRSKDGPFTGLYNGNTVQSQVAEVVWFLRPTLMSDGQTIANPPTFTLYRRVFLVMPTYQGNATSISPTTNGTLLIPALDFYTNNDISAHYDLAQGKFVANTLSDLTNRECRYGHAFINNAVLSNGFPHRVCPWYLVPFGGSLSNGNYSVDTSKSRYGQDVVLTNVVSFDVQMWDPTAPVYVQGSSANQVSVAPSDPGFPYLPGTPVGARVPDSIGSFVDLNWHGDAWDGSAVSAPWNTVANTNLTMSPFYSTGHPKSQLVATTSTPTDFTKTWMFDTSPNPTSPQTSPPDYQGNGYTPATFDVWTTHYEHDGLDQDKLLPPPLTDNTNGPDQALSGFQDFANNTETSPPYPVPLRGVKITIRCYEPDSRQTHEMSIVESFVPE
ncbi:MAG TPA: hypothetical protein VFE46_19225 [Pirellulales bacterium]|jgi:hypothetical protein|nr:hypothetical protein [Pirellulales bacterium]